MRIGLEMFGTQTAGRTRGIGRYVRSLAHALIVRTEQGGLAHELVLYADAEGPLDQLPAGPNAATRLIRPEPTLGAAVAGLVRENPDALDVLIFLNPLELTPGYDLPPRPVSASAPGGRTLVLTAVVHDLIPLVFPNDYLKSWPGPTMARRYRWALERLRQYDGLLTNSEATRLDVIDRLNVPPSRVVNIGAGGDNPGGGYTFDRARPDEEAADRTALDALGLSPPFLFAASALDPRKNLSGLLEAYARLPPALRSTHRLAVAAGIGPSDPAAAMVWSQAEVLGIHGALTLTGRVDDRTLRALYRRCAAFVFPSLYEGFGLPILEALRCGAAVVAGDNSSQPEVAGDAALLVNTADPGALAGAIARVLTDPALARTLRARGPDRAVRFTWDAVAARTLGVLHWLAEPARGNGPRPVQGPWAWARSGIEGSAPVPLQEEAASAPGAHRAMNRVCRRAWSLTESIRRPLRNRLAKFLTDCLARALATSELAQVLDALVTEQFRLQEKIDALQQRLDEVAPAGEAVLEEAR
jgi:glycosyltransferase involved in cell wall biosynthesis